MIFIIILIVSLMTEALEAKCTAQCKWRPPENPLLPDTRPCGITIGSHSLGDSDSDKGCYLCDDSRSINFYHQVEITKYKQCCKTGLPCLDAETLYSMSRFFDVPRMETGVYWHLFGNNAVNLLEVEVIKKYSRYSRARPEQEELCISIDYIHGKGTIKPIGGTITSELRCDFMDRDDQEQEYNLLSKKLQLARQARERDTELLDKYVKEKYKL